MSNTMIGRLAVSLRRQLALLRFALRPTTPEELQRARAKFDPEFYVSHYGHELDKNQDPFDHYIRVGWLRGNNPNSWFDTNGYLARYSDVRRAGLNPFVHFLNNGRKEGRLTRAPDDRQGPTSDEVYRTVEAEFDTDYYLLTNPSLRNTSINPVSHYLSVGWIKGLNPNAKFDTRYYLDSNPDVRNSKLNPFYHYIRFGRAEGRKPSSFAGVPRPIPLTSAVTKKDRNCSDDPIASAVVVVPIYNNTGDVAALLPNLAATLNESTPVILINDQSSDDDILPLLSHWVERQVSWLLINNKENLGFAKSVNRGISEVDGHVVIVNTDVLFPEDWLPRLLAPIHAHPKEIASTTPFSNNSSFTGFPSPRAEWALTDPCMLSSVDSAFSKIQPSYPDIPAGIGFCMAMNGEVIKRIGGLDCDSYGKGYFEDTDWCQRAVIAGYRNVACDNLFVHHKTDSKSFGRQSRVVLSAENKAIFLSRYPHFTSEETQFYAFDPLREIRAAAQYKLWRQNARSAHLIVTHSWGGGANYYVEELTSRLLNDGDFILEFIIRSNQVTITTRHQGDSLVLEESYSHAIWTLVEWLDIDQISVNGIHSANNPLDIVKELATLASRIRTTIYLHDFLAVCPSIFLLKNDHSYCGIPEIGDCHSCFFDNRNIRYTAPNMVEWRRAWRSLLEVAHEIISFSPSSKEILLRVYPEIDPKKVNVIDPNYRVTLTAPARPASHSSLNIGVLGTMYPHKGSRVVLQLEQFLRQNNVNATVTVFGDWLDIAPPKTMKVLGRYEVPQLPKLLTESAIDVILFPSVCPETYSRTLSEIFALELPVVGLGLGAQRERVSQYRYGVTVGAPDPGKIVAALYEAARKKYEASTAGKG